MNPLPPEYAEFILTAMAISLFVGMVLGMLIGLSQDKEPCSTCAGIVREHAQALRSANRIKAAAGRSHRRLRAEVPSNRAEADDDGPWYDSWEDAGAR